MNLVKGGGQNSSVRNEKSESIVSILRSIAGAFEVVLGSSDHVAESCDRLRQQLGNPPTVSDIEHLCQLLPLLRKRAGAIATPLFALLEEVVTACPCARAKTPTMRMAPCRYNPKDTGGLRRHTVSGLLPDASASHSSSFLVWHPQDPCPRPHPTCAEVPYDQRQLDFPPCCLIQECYQPILVQPPFPAG